MRREVAFGLVRIALVIGVALVLINLYLPATPAIGEWLADTMLNSNP